MGLALKEKGHQIRLVVTRRPSTARQAAKTFGLRTVALSSRQLNELSAGHHDILNRCSLILITTPDDSIPSIVRALATLMTPDSARRVALHTSGALASDVLHPLRGARVALGSLHPLVSISDSRSGARALTRAFFSVEGDPQAVRTARTLVKQLGGQSFKLDSGTKALYHAAAVTAAPNMTALFDIALEMMGRCGLSARRARQVLLPLLESTVANLAKQDPAQALTGTFKRGDLSTVRKHIGALNAVNLPQALAAYVVLGQRSISLARKGKSNRADLDQIALLLAATRTSPAE
jgi:predicted short-subunit dehydrogenase-like oxidoreductase (DUF2520 family)